MKKVFIIVNIFLLFLIFFEGWQFLKVWSAESALSFIKQGAVSLPVLPTTEGRGRGKSDKKNDSLREGMVLSETSFEKEGVVNNVVFPCGFILKKDKIYLYYGGADKVVCGATISLDLLLANEGSGGFWFEKEGERHLNWQRARDG